MNIIDLHNSVAEAYDEVSYFYEKRKWYNIWLKYELVYVQNVIKKYCSNRDSKILDIGCGTGDYLESLLVDNYINLVGVDISKAMLKKAMLKLNDSLKNGFCSLFCSDILKISDYCNSFDFIYSIRTFSHIFEKVLAIKEINQLLKYNGYFLLIDIHHSHDKKVAMSYNNIWKPIPTAEYLSREQYNSLLSTFGFNEILYKEFSINSDGNFEWNEKSDFYNDPILFMSLYKKLI